MKRDITADHLQPLTYGSTVFLSPQGDPDFFVYSDGFVKTTLSLRNTSKEKSRGTFDRCLFKVYPSFANNVKKEALGISELFSKHSYNEEKKQEIAEDLKDRLASEFKFNLESYEKSQGNLIPFDQPVQFLHVASNKFLSLLNQEADIERENFKLELVEYPSEWTIFQFTPCFKHQRESKGVIYSEDFTYLTSAQLFQKKTPYIHSNIVEEDEEQLLPSVQPTMHRTYHSTPDFNKRIRLIQHRESVAEINPNAQKSSKLKREVNASIEYSLKWQLHIFTEPIDEEDYLSYGDVIWINNAESNCTLITKMDANQLPVVEFIKAIPTDSFQHYVGHTNGMWSIEHREIEVGGLVKWEHAFRLKSLTSSQYLSIKKEGSKYSAGVAEMTNDLWKFVPVPSAFAGKDPTKAKLYIPKKTFVFLQAQRLKVSADPKKPLEMGATLTLFLRSFSTTPLMEEECEEHDTCKINHANMNEILETNFLVSCFPILKKYADFSVQLQKLYEELYKDRLLVQKLERRIQKMLKTLSVLEDFCTNKILISSMDQKFGQPNAFRQKLLREQYFIQMLVDILTKSVRLEEIIKVQSLSPTKKKQPMLAQLIRKHGLVKKDGRFGDQENPVETKLILMKCQVIREVLLLLPKVCEGNFGNKRYLYRLIPRIKFLLKYFEEATQLIINILQNNEELLSEISEDWRFDFESDPEGRFKIAENASSINDLYANESPKRIAAFGVGIVFGASNSKSKKKKRFDARTKTTISINDNLIYHYMKILNSTDKKKNYLHFLKFFRSLTTCEEKAVSTNQEILFNIFRMNDKIYQNLFIASKIAADNLLLTIENGSTIDLNQCLAQGKIVQNERELSYFQEQLRFFSDLLLDRNYLWKAQLEKAFPVDFAFRQIYNENLPLSLRAVFCQLVVSLYIDHEPLNETETPARCRTFKREAVKDEPTDFPELQLNKLKSNDNYDTMQELFVSSLLEEICKIIHATKAKIRDELKQKCESNEENNNENKALASDFLNNELLQKITYMLVKISKFDGFNVFKKIDLYPQFARELFGLLEYDKSNPSLTYSIVKTRETNFERIAKANKKNKMLAAFTSVVGNVADLGKGLASIVSDTVFGKKKSKSIGKVLESGGEDSKLNNNPLMKGLISLVDQIDRAVKGNDTVFLENEMKIKSQIAEFLLHLINHRQDFLIQNFLSWFDDILAKEGKSLLSGNIMDVGETLVEIINSQGISVLPQ